jgi:hypothetical protein
MKIHKSLWEYKKNTSNIPVDGALFKKHVYPVKQECDNNAQAPICANLGLRQAIGYICRYMNQY